jgi:hypothetical protein
MMPHVFARLFDSLAARRQRLLARRLNDVRAMALGLATQEIEPTDAQMHAYARLHRGHLFRVGWVF